MAPPQTADDADVGLSSQQQATLLALLTQCPDALLTGIERAVAEWPGRRSVFLIQAISSERSLRTRRALEQVEPRVAGTDGLAGTGFDLKRTQRVLFGNRNKVTDFMTEEQLQSPGRLILKNFLHNRLGMTGLIVFLLIFLLVMIGPKFYTLDLSYQDNTQLNVAPGMNMMKIPDGMKLATDNNSLSNYMIAADLDTASGNKYTGKIKKSPSENIYSLVFNGVTYWSIDTSVSGQLTIQVLPNTLKNLIVPSKTTDHYVEIRYALRLDDATAWNERTLEEKTYTNRITQSTALS